MTWGQLLLQSAWPLSEGNVPCTWITKCQCIETYLTKNLQNPTLTGYPVSLTRVNNFTELLHCSVIVAGIIGGKPTGLQIMQWPVRTCTYYLVATIPFHVSHSDQQSAQARLPYWHLSDYLQKAWMPVARTWAPNLVAGHWGKRCSVLWSKGMGRQLQRSRYRR